MQGKPCRGREEVLITKGFRSVKEGGMKRRTGRRRRGEGEKGRRGEGGMD